MFKRVVSVVGAVAVALAAFAAPISATITGTSGAVVKIAPPPSVKAGALASNTTIFAFDEKAGYTLASNLPIDINSLGTYDEYTDLLPVGPTSVIPVGTRIDSHFLHVDKASGSNINYSGYARFDTQILGVAVRAETLDGSDFLGAPGTLYPTGIQPNRKLELQPDSTDLVILPDGYTIQFNAHMGIGLDQVRVITRHSQPPTGTISGPSTGVEGTPVTLTATASDPDGDPLTITWDIVGVPYYLDPGATCTTTGETTLTPTFVCTDDALVLAQVSISDGANMPLVLWMFITIGNAPPSVGALTLPSGPVAPGTPVSAGAVFSDPGTNDTHSATITWGDTTSSAATVVESTGSGTADGTHTYASAGVYPVTLTVTDDDLGVTSTTGTVVVNGPPTADAAGPYSGAEGSAIGLAGTAVDPEGDPLTLGWTFAPTAADPGTTCTPTGDATLTPTLTCTDDAVVTADLSASDGINPPAVSSTSVTVANESPALDIPVATAPPIATGNPMNVSADFTDAGENDTHTATIAWGDTESSVGSVAEVPGSGTASGTHTYALPGTYIVTVTVTDDDLAYDTRSVTIVVNSPPIASADGPYAGFEGDVLALTGTASDPDSDPLAISWSFALSGAEDPGTVCTPTGETTLTPTLTCSDDATVTATLTVDDGVNPPVSSITTVLVGNSLPAIGAATPSSSLVPVGSTVSVSAAFTDNGTNDTHTASVDWGDTTTSAGTVTEAAGSGTASAPHAYALPGTYTVTVTVSDDNSGTASSSTTIVVNGAPTAGAGGPYTGVEGAPVTLSGTATDAEGDVLSVSWSFTVDSADPGTVCTPADTSTLTPTLTCTDDASVTAALTVTDGINPVVEDSTTVTVNNAPPSVGTVGASVNPVTVGVPVSVTAPFTDVGVNDNHTATINWGPSTSAGAVTEIPGSGSVTGSHTYGAPGSYLVTVKVNDKDGGFNSSSVTIVVNAPAAVDAGGPYSGFEGSPVALSGIASDPEGDPLSYAWTFSISGADAGTSCSATGSTTPAPSLTCNDDATVTATLSVSDGINPPVSDSAIVAIANRPPVITSLAVPLSPIQIGSSEDDHDHDGDIDEDDLHHDGDHDGHDDGPPPPTSATVSVTATFTDAGANDTHTAVIDWEGATSAGTVNETTGTVTGYHVYTTPGTYTVTVTVYDDNGGSDTEVAQSYVVVYDPGAGFVTGGGWINSPSGAYTPGNPSDYNYVGKANFGFESKYHDHETVPSGSTEFQLKSAGMNMKSTGYMWLVVTDSGTKAYYRGTGKVNKVSGYEFVLSVIDGGQAAVDKFRIKVWNPSTGSVVYDNQAGALDDDSAVTGIGSGSIKIHT